MSCGIRLASGFGTNTIVSNMIFFPKNQSSALGQKDGQISSQLPSTVMFAMIRVSDHVQELLIRINTTWKITPEVIPKMIRVQAFLGGVIPWKGV